MILAPMAFTDPADKQIDAAADGQFQSTAGGPDLADRYTRAAHIAAKGGTLYAGEGLLLLQRIAALEAALEQAQGDRRFDQVEVTAPQRQE